jgi:hypothetical protein
MIDGLMGYPRVYTRKRGEYTELRAVGPDGEEFWWRVDDPWRGRPDCAVLPLDLDAHFAGYEHERAAALERMRARTSV